MKGQYKYWRSIAGVWALLLWACTAAHAQFSGIMVDMSPVDGIELNPDNVFSYRINNQKGKTVQAEVTGRLQYRRSALMFTYKYTVSLQPGITSISRNTIPSPAWTFSDNGLRELFFNYGKLPEGTYEYCVSVVLKNTGESSTAGEPDACVYQTVNDIFLINLIDPENDAKLHEYNPMLSWVVNYPFASELTYRIRVAELKQGQNAQNAIARNNPVYQDNHVMATGTVYPVTATPLVKFQPYVWTVDAYYKGILLGGSEVWKFTIIEDSELKAVPADQSYYEFEKHNGDTRLYAVGQLKLKYTCDLNTDTLQLRLFNSSGTELPLQDKTMPLVLGDNRLVFSIQDKLNLTHQGKYQLSLSRGDKRTFIVPFTYINPLFQQ